jgi:hypothetical protein
MPEFALRQPTRNVVAGANPYRSRAGACTARLVSAQSQTASWSRAAVSYGVRMHLRRLARFLGAHLKHAMARAAIERLGLEPRARDGMPYGEKANIYERLS